MSKSHKNKRINNTSKNKNGLPNGMPTILRLLSLITFATAEKKAQTLLFHS